MHAFIKYLFFKKKLCLVTVFVFYFQKVFFGNIKKKQFSCIFKIKKRVWLVEIKKKKSFLKKKK